MKLTIKSIGPKDYGVYKCISKNSLGDMEGTINVYRIPDPNKYIPSNKRQQAYDEKISGTREENMKKLLNDTSRRIGLEAGTKEIAMLLPGALSHSRTANDTSDIRNNLRVKDPTKNPQYDPERSYCVEFEVLKASKACRKEENFKTLKEGDRVCVRCESEALHENLEWRCQGHGVEGRVTRWSALSAPHCHGKWLRAHSESDKTCSKNTCKNGVGFIFV
nr:uncharacterized protein LOC111513538 [Leptinotarsa decemlineata]